MANLSEKQIEVLQELKKDYGHPDILKIEHTSQQFGLVWCCWISKSPQNRNLFIHQDGQRLSWDLISSKASG